MMTAEQRRTVALVLFAVALGLLFAGRYISFDRWTDSSDSIYPLGHLAAAPVLAAVIVAWPEPKALLWLGIAFAVLTLLSIWQDVVNVSFRFIWDSSELQIFELILFLLSSLLLATAGVRLGVRPWLLRIPAYLIGTALMTITVALLFVVYFGRTCTGEEEQGCTAAVGGVVVGAMVGFLVSPVLFLVIELILWRRRRRRRKAAEVGSR